MLAAELIEDLEPDEALEVLADAFPGVDLDELDRKWRGWLARPEQLAPEDPDWVVWAFVGGRGSGKSRTGSEWILERAKQFEAAKNRSRQRHRVALIARTPADVRDVMIEGESGLIASCELAGLKHKYEPSKRRFTIRELSTIMTAFSAQVPDGPRGPQYHTAWADEPAAWGMTVDGQGNSVWTNLRFGLRLTHPGMKPRVIATTTPKPVPLIQEWFDDVEAGKARTVMTRASLFDNMPYLDPSFIADILDRYDGTTLALQEIHGLLTNFVEGALWRPERIIHVPAYPDLAKVAIGIDPPGGATECGIVAVGIDQATEAKLRKGYVLEDASLKAPPEVWAETAVSCWRRWNEIAPAVLVAETNFGGDMVKRNIAAVDATVPVVEVRAGKGQDKAARATPVSGLYGGQPILTAQGVPLLGADGQPIMRAPRIFHVGAHGLLESEMCTWTPDEKWSPNRMDAEVWAVHHLFPNLTQAPASATRPAARPAPTGAAAVTGTRQRITR